MKKQISKITKEGLVERVLTEKKYVKMIKTEIEENDSKHHAAIIGFWRFNKERDELECYHDQEVPNPLKREIRRTP